MHRCGSALLAGSSRPARGQLNAFPASPPRGAVRCGGRGRNESGASQHRPVLRQPSASASRPWAATSDEALQAPKATSTCHPPPNQPPTPQVKRPKEKKRPPRKECLARHCPDHRPSAKIKELAAFSDPTNSFFLSTMHAAADADCCSCPLNSPLEPSYRASSLPRRHRLHPIPSPSPSPSTSPSTSSHPRDPTTTDRLSGSSDPRP